MAATAAGAAVAAADQVAAATAGDRRPPTVWVMSPAEYAAWNSARKPRVVQAAAAGDQDEAAAGEEDDNDAGRKLGGLADGTPAGDADTADKKRPRGNRDGGAGGARSSPPPREADKPATVHGVEFPKMADLRGHVKAIVARGNPVAAADAAFMVALLRHHPKAKSLFAGATAAPTHHLRIQALSNGDPAVFIEKREGGAGRAFAHFPHKLAIKSLFPLSSMPRRQTWHAMQRRRRGGGGGRGGGGAGGGGGGRGSGGPRR